MFEGPLIPNTEGTNAALSPRHPPCLLRSTRYEFCIPEWTKVLTACTVVSSRTRNCSQAWCKAQEETMHRRKKTHQIQVPRTMLHNIHQLAQLQVLVRTVRHVHETSQECGKLNILRGANLLIFYIALFHSP